MKMVRGFVAMGVVAMAMGAAAQTTYKIDPYHSEADFGIKHMAITTVHGSFRGVTGTIVFDESNAAKDSVDATIDVNTVNTGVDPRDKHLKSPDFFDTAKFPTMTYKSTSVKKTADGYEVYGNLTLHGVTKPVTLKLETPGKEQTMDGKAIKRGFTATTTIKRQDFGLTWNGTLKSGDNALGDDVKIELDIEAAK